MTDHATTPQTYQRLEEVVDNPIALDRSGAAKMIEALNTDVASMFMLFQQLQKHHWVAEGPEFRDIHLLLQAHYEATHLEIDLIGERIVTLGGVPIAAADDQERFSYATPEQEGIFDQREMLQHDLEAYRQIIPRLRDHIRLAITLGDFGTEHMLKTVLSQVEGRTVEIKHMLEEETLSEGLMGKAKEVQA